MVEEGATAAASRSGPAPFLSKTHQMVEERGTDEVISWAEQGRSFVVWKPVELARDLLPLHFKHCNFSSFVSQLERGGEEGKSVKLFGVLLTDAARKRARCEEAAASERPIKMIRIGEPWIGVPSSGPGRCGGGN
ncbi:Heat stress transcription factor B-3 [Zea mays]|uniref:Heat stress transcription factor B-3 n=1 Tax=Zea mays TaxID=4577 RepID=A0A1D6ERG1_MAIZE|nr:Heat stress transcription factor B-3 [Zea mays]